MYVLTFCMRKVKRDMGIKPDSILSHFISEFRCCHGLMTHDL